MAATAQVEDAPSLAFPMESRAAIRSRIRAARRALEGAERRRLTDALARRLASSHLFLRSRHIAFYLANDGEVDLGALYEKTLAMGKRCYLPVLVPWGHNRLWFAPYRPQTPLTPNRFSIPEPLGNRSALRRPWALDLILTPLVAFDDTGNRLGMGGGFYDRTLAYLGRRRVWRKPALLGVAFELQRVERLPSEAWDIPLQGVVTDAGFYELAGR